MRAQRIYVRCIPPPLERAALNSETFGNSLCGNYTQFDLTTTLKPCDQKIHSRRRSRRRLAPKAFEALEELLADENAVEIFRVPGSFEIPLCALKAAESGKFDAVICLGVIIRGETPHFDYIAAETARGISEAALKTGVPLLFGVITADNIDQAIDRAGEKLNNKGYEAARAAVELANLYQEVFGTEPRAVARG